VLRGPGEYFDLVGVTRHVLGTRIINGLTILFIPMMGIGFDLSGKVFSNMFYPTQTQIHIEIEAKERVEQNKRDRQSGNESNSNVAVITPNV
jgi:hypothetical protein